VTQPKPSLPVGEMTASRVAIGSTRQTKAESWSCSFVMARASQDLANPTHGQGRNKEYKSRWRAWSGSTRGPSRALRFTSGAT